jgi:Ser/Thr protein kinase RdoA (MazF antagonist)
MIKLVHQDIKLDNICIDKGKAILIDFEFCRSIE